MPLVLVPCVYRGQTQAFKRGLNAASLEPPIPVAFSCPFKGVLNMLRDTIVCPDLMLHLWHAFMLTEHASDNVCDDWSMYCMGGEL